MHAFRENAEKTQFYDLELKFRDDELATSCVIIDDVEIESLSPN